MVVIEPKHVGAVWM